ncbi:uncharacterized protein LOC114303122 [Camellia sinensis]|uniref:Uncharacterized protein n=1 Tax=Camellia sinensis var. sinensis TaxID=542762 RepID=A0A4S4EXF1_CAMSN|nr:uncharacterized protein LOC114303122 [Camellia sinensis]THG21392.1 hypothetical protein TEA_016330 [Camellia sinensis var. sinensis]
MARNLADQKWVLNPTISIENEVEEDNEEEALSFCDLPINGDIQSTKQEPQSVVDDFHFGRSVFAEPEMCAADELFFQGQIVPLRHSVSSDSNLLIFPIHRSKSMDNCYFGRFNSVSSRSSSQHSSSSASSTATASAATTYKQRVRNRFHSQPSPSPNPRTRISSGQYGNLSHRSRKLTTWSLFRPGLVRTPKIELQDLKVRSSSTRTQKPITESNTFISHEMSPIFLRTPYLCEGVMSDSVIDFCISRSTSTSNRTSGDSDDRDKNGSSKIERKKKKKKKQRLVDRNGTLFGGCKCTVDAVETVPSQDQKVQAKKKKNRTFEWLKELSLADIQDEA